MLLQHEHSSLSLHPAQHQSEGSSPFYFILSFIALVKLTTASHVTACPETVTISVGSRSMCSLCLTDIVQIKSIIPPGCVKLLLLVLPCSFGVLALLAKLLISSLHKSKAWMSC